MSKLNINFNDKNYEVDNSALSEPRADFISHLGTIAGEGLKIIVDGVEYSVDPTKLNGAVISLEAVLNNLNAGGDVPTETLAPGLYQTGAIALYESGDVAGAEAMLTTSWDELVSSGAITVEDGAVAVGKVLPKLPAKNEYGFYYGVPYSLSDFSFVFYEDGAVEQYEYGELIATYPAGFAEYSANSIYISDFETTFMISSDGLTIEELNFGDIFELGSLAQIVGELIVPNDGSIMAIGEGAFRYQVDLTNITIPDSVTSIRDYAFEGSGLTSVVIPQGVTSLSYYAFCACLNLVSVVLPDSITRIEHSAFRECNSLKSVNIPNGVTAIEGQAFENTNLEGITIPSSVTFISFFIFRGASFSTVNFNGTIEQWHNIEKNPAWAGESAITTVICSDGDVAL